MKIPAFPSSRSQRVRWCLLCSCLAVIALSAGDPYAMNERLGRGVNFGNALDAPSEGEWGVVLREEFFDAAKAAGFDSIRLPVRWSAHAAMEAPYTIDPAWFARVEWAVDQALRRDLAVILNLHHYREIYADPAPHRDRFMGLWKQIAPHFRDLPNDLVVFEPMNEPDENFTPEMWNEWLREVIAIIRCSNPARTLMIGPGEDNVVEYLDALRLPEDDRNIIVTIHNYHPLPFTHQGAEWLTWADTSEWLGTEWGSEEDMAALLKEMDTAAAWGKRHDRPLNLGEFGAIRMADPASRARWTRALTEAAVERGMSFHYWEFCAHWFGLYDQESASFVRPLLEAVLPDSPVLER
jgi:endoglucanase